MYVSRNNGARLCILALEKQYVCSLRYPACSAPYCHLWPARLYNTFPQYFVNGTIFEKKKLRNIKCVF